MKKNLNFVMLTLAIFSYAAPAFAAKRYTAEELAAPALIPPRINTSPLPQYSSENLDFGMVIGMERTPEGRLWACWVGGGDNDLAFFLLASSDDDGLTWSQPRVVIDPHDEGMPLNRRTVVGNLWTDPQGRLWLFFDMSMSQFDGRAGSWYTICKNPDADNPQWSEPVRIWHGSTLQKPTVLSNGEWVLPVSLWQKRSIRRVFRSQLHDRDAAFNELDNLRMAHAFVSIDQGKTWERRGGVRFPEPQFDEHMFVELEDGRLWMTARTAKGMFESFSSDGGRIWSEPQPTPMRNATSRHFIRRLQSGNLLLVKHGEQIDAIPDDPRHNGRSHLTAFISKDDGKTWEGGLLLDERGRVTYPDGVQAPDGTIYIVYDYNRGTAGEVLMAKFTEADVLARKFESPRAMQKLLVSKPNPEAVKKRREKEAQEKRKEEQRRAKSPSPLPLDPHPNEG